MLYVRFADPGQISAEAMITMDWPARAKLSAAFRGRRVMRFDHHNRWFQNCIGLWNHRQFIVVLGGLTIIGIMGFVVDIVVFFCYSQKLSRPVDIVYCMILLRGDISLFATVVHIVYSIYLLLLVIPLARLHVGFVSRNELAEEWKENVYYRVGDRLTGEPVRVLDLSDEDEIENRLDQFIYDRNLNPYDHGCFRNWQAFWCTSRCSRAQRGDF